MKSLILLLPLLLLSACSLKMPRPEQKDVYYENSWQKQMLENNEAFKPEQWSEWDKKYPISDDTIITVCDVEKGVCLSKQAK